MTNPVRDVLAYLFIGVVVITLVGLGAWQLQRLEEKQEFIDAFEKAKHEPPLALTVINTEDLRPLEFRRVTTHGVFLHQKTLFLGGRSYGRDTGYHLLTPLRMDDGRTVLVNRGWVPMDQKDPETRPGSDPGDEVEVYGMLRLPRLGNMFTPGNHPDKNFWFTVDIPAMAKASNLRLEPYYIEVVDEDATFKDVPFPGTGELIIRNDHLGYAITWLSLAVAAAVMFGLYRKKQKANETLSV
jgi:surfeit locus 1 family protein